MVMNCTSDTRIPVAQIVSIISQSRTSWFVLAASNRRWYSSLVSSRSEERNTSRWILTAFSVRSCQPHHLKKPFREEITALTLAGRYCCSSSALYATSLSLVSAVAPAHRDRTVRSCLYFWMVAGAFRPVPDVVDTAPANSWSENSCSFVCAPLP